MKVKSTGLGKTQLQCHFDGFNKKEDGGQSVVMVITSTEPVHWHIEADLGGADLRQMAVQMLKPAVMWHLVKLLLSGSEAKGFVMEKEGGRRSTRERVSREPVVRGLDVAVAEAVGITTEAAETPVIEEAVPAAPAPGTTQVSAAGRPVAPRADGPRSDLSAREQRRAELRRQREEAARQYASA